jgi:hypothetical protein
LVLDNSYPLVDAALTAIAKQFPAVGILLADLSPIDLVNLREAVDEAIGGAGDDVLDAEVAAWPWHLGSARDGEIARWRGANPADAWQALEAESIDCNGDDSTYEIWASRGGKIICQGGAPDFDTALVFATGQLRDFLRADPSWTVRPPR